MGKVKTLFLKFYFNSKLILFFSIAIMTKQKFHFMWNDLLVKKRGGLLNMI
jgi:hypothetical protein